MPIAVLTDFGNSDYYVGAMKGVILSIDPSAVIVDITHEIGPQDIASASFVLAACYRDFPERTIFLCVVDPGVGSQRRSIIVQTDKYIFVGPDNGLFSLVLDESTSIHAIENRNYFRPLVSSTFHGRDIFAPVAAFLSQGIKLEEFGPLIYDPIRLPDPKPTKIHDNTFEGRVIHVDRFGNLVTNIPASLADRFSKIDVCDTSISTLHSSYADARSHGPFAIAGSAGFLEISVTCDSASKLLKAGVGTKLTLHCDERLS